MNQIAHVAGAPAKELILSGQNILLTPVLIQELRKLCPKNLAIALRKAAEGLHPRAPCVPKDTPSDLVRWDYHLSRLRQTNNVITQQDVLQPASSLNHEEKKALSREATAIRATLSALLLALKSLCGSYHLPRGGVIHAWKQEVPQLKSVKKVRKQIEMLAHDIPLVLSQHGASPQVFEALTSTTTDLLAWVHFLIENTRFFSWPPRSGASLLRDHAKEPDARFGTYIMILHSERPTVRRIGRLGTFWLPAGYYLYVGSACGGGGVAARTTRHGHSDACRMWNLDHLKAIARPVELWWTHHCKDKEKKLECPWALALAQLPDYCCPAPGFGSNDCKSCPAHLYHSLKRPSCKEFAAVIGQQFPEHDRIYRHFFS